MRKDIWITGLIVCLLVFMSAGVNVFDIRRSGGDGIAYFDYISADSINADVSTDTVTVTYLTATTGIVTTLSVTNAVDSFAVDTLEVNEYFTVDCSGYTVTAAGKQDNIMLTVDSLLINTSAADSFWVYDDGDTTRIQADNPVKLTGTMIVTDWVIGEGTFGTAKTADTVANAGISASDYAFITWTLAPDSVYEVGGGYAVTIKEDTLIVTCSFKETGTTYNYWVLDQ